jgi:hypothetical protein
MSNDAIGEENQPDPIGLSLNRSRRPKLARARAAIENAGMRIRVTWPDGKEKRATVRTWQELYRMMGSHDGGERYVSVIPDGDAFHVIVRGD